MQSATVEVSDEGWKVQPVGGDAPAAVAAISNELQQTRDMLLGGKHSTNSCEGFFPAAPKPLRCHELLLLQ